MPLFEYACRDCDRRFETLVFGGERPACPGCGSRSLEKLLSTFAVGAASGGTESAGESFADAGDDGGCGTCGDPRGPGACGLD
jgi:putative FmdB family regulatory protein